MNEHDAHENLEAPPAFAEALRNSQKAHVFVPKHIDDAILGQAREHLRANQRRFIGLPPWAAMAAAFVVTALVLYSFSSDPKTFAVEDINQDGEVDILDAFALARRIETGSSAEMDINGDGLTDHRDAEALARQAVELPKGGRS